MRGLQNVKGPARSAILPSHGSTIPYEEKSMNVCDDSMDDDRPATAEQCAAVEFEPMTEQVLSALPSNAEWAKDGAELLPTIRLAAIVMTKSKAELIAMFEENPSLTLDLHDACKNLIGYFDGFRQVLDGAASRLLICGSAASLKEPEKAS